MAYSLPPTVSPEALLQDLLAVSLTAINLLRPLYDPAGDLLDFAPEYFNPAAQRMTGLLTERPVGTARTLFPDIFTNGVFAFYRRVFESGEASYFEVNYQADGLDNYFRVAARRSGELLLVSFTDTADQDRSAVELALRESQAAEKAAEAEAQRQRFYEALMALPAQVATYYGPDHTYNFVNAAYRRYFPAPALPGRTLREVLPEAEAQGVLAVMDRVYQTGEPSYQQELEVWLNFDGNGRPRQLFLNLLFHPLRDAQGRIDGLLDFSYDVTEQVLARRQVEQLNEELGTHVQQRTREALALQADLLATAERQAAERQAFYHIFEQAPVLVALLRAPGHRYEYVNPAYQALFPGRQLLGLDMAEAVPEMQAQGFGALMDRVYQTGETYVGQQMPFTAQPAPGQQPQPAYYNFTYQAYRENGQIVGISIFAFDATEQVLTRQQVQDLNEKLTAINEELTVTNEELGDTNAQLTRTNVELDTFVYTASHDLKAPITNIEGITLALRETLPTEVRQDEMVSHLLDLLVQTTTRFQLTIGQLTDLSKLQLAHAGPAEPVPLAAVVESVRLDLAPAITAAAAQLTVEVTPDLLVSFSPANLRSTIYNLLSNAVKYRDPTRPAQVQIHAFLAGSRVVLTVQDNGLGLTEHQQQRLFGLFQRLHTHVEGTGVGLYITKRLVENGGGTIAVESQVNVGTTFTLTFPA